MPDNSMTCPSCGGSGKIHGNPDAWWCDVCGGQGWVNRETLRPRGTPSGGGFFSFWLSLLFLVAVVAVPLVALVVVLDWFAPLVPVVRGMVDALPEAVGAVTEPGEPGSPWPLTIAVALVALAVVVALRVRHGRSVRRADTRSDVWLARAWGVAFAAALVVAIPLVVTVGVVAAGQDLTNEAPSSNLTGWLPVTIVLVVVALVAWLQTGRLFLKEQRRAQRRPASA